MSYVPIGTILMFMGTLPPTGWVDCMETEVAPACAQMLELAAARERDADLSGESEEFKAAFRRQRYDRKMILKRSDQ